MTNDVQRERYIQMLASQGEIDKFVKGVVEKDLPKLQELVTQARAYHAAVGAPGTPLKVFCGKGDYGIAMRNKLTVWLRDTERYTKTLFEQSIVNETLHVFLVIE